MPEKECPVCKKGMKKLDDIIKNYNPIDWKPYTKEIVNAS